MKRVFKNPSCPNCGIKHKISVPLPCVVTIKDFHKRNCGVYVHDSKCKLNLLLNYQKHLKSCPVCFSIHNAKPANCLTQVRIQHEKECIEVIDASLVHHVKHSVNCKLEAFKKYCERNHFPY